MLRRLPLLALLLTASAVAAPPTARELGPKETAATLPFALHAGLGIEYPIRKAYAFTDRTGDYVLVITERIYQKAKPNPWSNIAVAILLRRDGPADFKPIQTVKNVINHDNDVSDQERSIWFWTKYMLPADLDGDGAIDPLFIYGTDTEGNGLDDGRLHLFVLHQGKVVGLRHQNGTLDPERHTTIDPAFYKLPKKIQAHIQTLMNTLEATDQALFPAGWEKQLAKRKTTIRE